MTSHEMTLRDWRVLWATYVLPYRRRALALGLTILATIALQVVSPQIVKRFIDAVTSRRTAPLTTLAVLYIAASLVQQVIGIFSAWLGQTVAWGTTNRLRADLLGHVLRLDQGFHKTTTPGELLQRVDGDIGMLAVFFSRFVLEIIGSALLFVVVMVVIWVQSVHAGLVLTIYSIVALAAMLSVRKIAVHRWRRVTETNAELFGFLEERLAGTVDIRASGGESWTLRGLLGAARNRQWAVRDARAWSQIPWGVAHAMMIVGTIVVFVLGATGVRSGSMTLGGAFALYSYLYLLMGPLQRVSDQVEQMQQAGAGARRALGLLATPSKLVDGPGAELPDGALAVHVDHVSARYGDDPPVLHDIDLHLEGGKVLGIVGRTGSGKSTLARLLVRQLDVDSGVVRIGGIDVRTPTLAQLRGRVALVTQEVQLLRATVRQNLTLFDDSIPDDRIHAALDALGLDTWVSALSDGLSTSIGEGGEGLSAGEAQLLAFGRAFLREPGLVILDEASSRLDPATERLLETAVAGLLRDRTAIVIAHRLSTLARADDICVIEDGRIAEHGTRIELATDQASRFSDLLRTGLEEAWV